MPKLTSIELCAGAGGQALGLEQAGFKHAAVVEIEPHACHTLRLNRPQWNVIEWDMTDKDFSLQKFKGVDLLAAGVPCPPFSLAGKQLGADDERDLFPAVLRFVEQCVPEAILFENVRGILNSKFDSYRAVLKNKLKELGYYTPDEWKLLHASDFGVPQLRPRAISVALKPKYVQHFEWPKKSDKYQVTVGEALYAEMASMGWDGVDEWKKNANKIAPTLVGGSKKHGGPDLGPTRAKRAWAELGVNAHTIAEEPPSNGFTEMPRLTVRMAALIQGFDPDWVFAGGKTAAYKQVGNAFPPPVAKAVGHKIAEALKKGNNHEWITV